MKRSLILTVLFLLLGLTVYCQDTTINKQLYNKILISLDNCDNEVSFYKSELEKCNLSDSLKTIVLSKYVTQCDKKLAEKDKKIKSSKWKGFGNGVLVGAALMILIKIIL